MARAKGLGFGRSSLQRTRHLHFLEPAPLGFQLCYLTPASLIESARLYEFDHTSQLIAVKPGAVRFADIHDHVRIARKIDAIHQLVTDWTGEGAGLARCPHGKLNEAFGQCKKPGFVPPVKTDASKGGGIDPQTLAFG